MRHAHIELAELERLFRNADPDPTDQQAEVREHLQHCTECSGLAQTYTLLLQKGLPIHNSSPIECPPEEVWFNLAVDHLSDDEALAYLAHTGRCGRCADQLRDAMEIVGLSKIEEGVVPLKSSKKKWQNDLAARLTGMDHIKKSMELVEAAPRRSYHWQPIFWGSIAAALLVAVMMFGLRQYRLGSDEALLASAYNHQRRTDLRLAGGDPVERASPTRGTSDAGESVELLTLRVRAQEHLDKNPSDAYWQQILGRVALVENDGDAARKKFEIASALNGGLPGLKLDLAAAYFEMGEANDDHIQYARAADLYGQVIDDPKEIAQRPLAYFNRALSWQRQHIYYEAKRDYESALALEKSPSWRDEIKKQLERLKLDMQKSEEDGGREPDLSPAAFLRAARLDPGQARDDYEIYLDEAAREWLSLRGSTPMAEDALQQLALIGLKHQDAWLHDMLRSSENDASRLAADHLVQGLRSSKLGEADNALTNLAAASKLYNKAHNPAGELRARVEMIYTLQRMGRSQQCLAMAMPLEHDRQLTNYSWLYSYFLLETATCRSVHGNLLAFTHGVARSLEVSRSSGLRLEVLRGQGFLVEGLDALGRQQTAWRLAERGLDDSTQSRGTPMNTYRFLYFIYSCMQSQNLLWAAANTADAAAHASQAVDNLQIRAYAQEVLGTAETAVGHAASAKEAFTAASSILKSMSAGKAVSLYGADWESDRSALQAREGHVPLAVLAMQRVEAEISTTDNDDIRQRHYTQFGNLFLQANEPTRALDKLLTATQDAEQALSATSNEVERLAWEKDNGRGYRLLVQCLVEMGESDQALRAWEWYHSAPYRAAARGADFRHLAYGLPPLHTIPTDRPHSVTIIIAKLEDFYVAWSVTNSSTPTRMVVLADSPAHIADLAHTLTELCSDRDSSQRDIHVVGINLYRDLLLPFEDQIQQANLLALDVDKNLQRIPFAALTRLDHRYLNDTHALVFLPDWWTLHSPSVDIIPASPRALMVEGALSLPRSASPLTATIPAEYLESGEISAHFPRGLLLRSQQSNVALLQKLLPEAELFHFSGHTFTVGDQTGLLIRSPDVVFGPTSLTRVSLRRCRLAVLATCSGVGRSDGSPEEASNSNLAHALLIAGASNVVATLWDVDSRASKIMMLQLYDSLSQSLPIPIALHFAQQKLRVDSTRSHPFFWSSVEDFTQ